MEELEARKQNTVPRFVWGMNPEKASLTEQEYHSFHDTVPVVRMTERTTHPIREIAGFKTCPGHCLQNGAFELWGGVNFTIQSQHATYVELVLFERHAEAPFAVLPFPDDYRIGNVYSMIVFGLDI